MRRQEKSTALSGPNSKAGEAIDANDFWIAAHALASGLTLVTNHENEFRRVRGLKVQNWAA